MNDDECVRFLQSVLPRLGLRWPGYRRVRRRVCKRIGRRLRALQLADLDAYRIRLETDADEWDVLDSLCRVTISRFFRDRWMFDSLGADILPDLAGRARARGDRLVRCWSAGCASGEEPYSLNILWRFRIAPGFPDTGIAVVATDADAHMLDRARRACYAPATLREVPADWRAAAFEPHGRQLRLRAPYRADVEFRCEDIRIAMPDGPFDLVLCRNLAFTYFESAVQRDVLRGIADRIDEHGYLVIGGHETLPDKGAGFSGEGMPRAVFRAIREPPPQIQNAGAFP